MIEEDYVSFKIAKLLKEKGFNEKCQKVYMYTGELICTANFMEGESVVDGADIEATAAYDGWIIPTQGDYAYLCPTQQMAMKWLREVHNLFIEMHIQNNGSYIGYIYNTNGFALVGWDKRRVSGSYEQAVEAAIQYSLENLI